MAIPIVPIAGAVLKYGPLAVAGLATLAYLRAQPGHADQRAEDLLDEVGEGMQASRSHEGRQINSRGRYRRVIRAGRTGPGIELDASFLGRIRVRRT
ncbi:MAG: hypothetical protein QNI90_16985 [Dinoroseobacter sp.]|nr:hypothetical protein [Dinoroseobacter sp.]MDJ0995275.1 hypothetical protein [Dinoroseobacter sp.]